MRIARIKIKNFRGIKNGELLFPKYVVLAGDNNCGKSTVIEAIDLCLGPERLSRHPVIDEHDFHAGEYIGTERNPIEIRIEVVVVDLSEEQERDFRNHVEWWNNQTNSLLNSPPAEGTDHPHIESALRVGFVGKYDEEEDDFVGSTYFLSPTPDDGEFDTFKTSDKRKCGFLFLRTLRTGSRALSLERGSLLDIILRLQDKRLQMWEDILSELRQLPVAEQQELGISEILISVQNAVREFVPSDWAGQPRMRVSDLTRESLRRTLTVFMGTGAKDSNGNEYAAPFQHQGTGTINTLVLALLSLIADLKQNVIFAMEEPEIAIPPYTQKRIVDNVCKKSAQAIFTSHSPYVIGEFKPSEVLVLSRTNGELTGVLAEYPPAVKPKAYRTEFRSRFCEAILAKRVLILEGRTEFDAIPAAARRLNELHPDQFKSLEGLGVAIIDAQTDTQVAPLGTHFKRLGKLVFAVFDQQSATSRAEITTAVHHPYEAPEKGFEKVILNGTAESALRRFALALVAEQGWPRHLAGTTPNATMPLQALKDCLGEYFKWSKGEGTAADLLGQCARDEMPAFIRDTLTNIQNNIEPPQQPNPPAPPGTPPPPPSAPAAPVPPVSTSAPQQRPPATTAQRVSNYLQAVASPQALPPSAATAPVSSGSSTAPPRPARPIPSPSTSAPSAPPPRRKQGQ